MEWNDRVYDVTRVYVISMEMMHGMSFTKKPVTNWEETLVFYFETVDPQDMTIERLMRCDSFNLSLYECIPCFEQDFFGHWFF